MRKGRSGRPLRPCVREGDERLTEQSGPGADEEMAELILPVLGLLPEDAHEVARRPLPIATA